MAKNKKGGVKKEKQVHNHKHSGNETKSSQAQNGSQKKQETQLVSGKQKGHTTPQQQNLKQRPPHLKKGTSKCFVLSLVLISIGVAGIAVFFSDDLQQGLDTALEDYVRPQVLALQKILQLESEPQKSEAMRAGSKRDEVDESGDAQVSEDDDEIKVDKQEETGTQEQSLVDEVLKNMEAAADSVTHDDRKTDENSGSSHQDRADEQKVENFKQRKEVSEDNVIQKRMHTKEEVQPREMKNEEREAKMEEENALKEEEKVLEDKPVVEGIKVKITPSPGAHEHNEEKAEMKTEIPVFETAEGTGGNIKDEEQRNKIPEDQRKMDEDVIEKRKLEQKKDEGKNVQAGQKSQNEGGKIKSKPMKTDGNEDADSVKKEKKEKDNTFTHEDKLKKTMSLQTEKDTKDGKTDEKSREDKVKKNDKKTEEKNDEKDGEKALRKGEKKADNSFEETKMKEMMSKKKDRRKNEDKKEEKLGNLKENKEEEKSRKEKTAREEIKKDGKKMEGKKDEKNDKATETERPGLTEKEDRGNMETEKEVKKQTEEHKPKTSLNREAGGKTETNKEKPPSEKERREQEMRKPEDQVIVEKGERKEDLNIKEESSSTKDGNVDVKIEEGGKDVEKVGRQDMKKEGAKEKENEKTEQQKTEVKDNKDREKFQKDEPSHVKEEDTRNKGLEKKAEKTKTGQEEKKDQQKVADEEKDRDEGKKAETEKKKGVKDVSREKSKTSETKKTDELLNTEETVKSVKKDRAEDKANKNSDKQQQRATYVLSSITNDEDFLIRADLDEADLLWRTKLYQEALAIYDAILTKNPLSPRALHGKGLTLDKLGFVYRSNEYLERAIDFLERVMVLHNVPDDLIKKNGRVLAERMQFRGWGLRAVKTCKILHNRFPDDIDIHNEFGVSYLMVGQNERAKDVFKQVLNKDPKNGFAKVHLGFLLKTMEIDYNLAVQYLAEGIASGKPGTSDGRFYLHLGDALIRLGREPEARKYYKEGEEKGLFLSRWQRSLYNVPELTARPFWTPEETGYQEYLKLLEENWKVIRDEGLAQLNSSTGSFQAEEENLRETGEWKQFTLFQQGRKNKQNCEKVPKTCALISRIPPAKSCKRGQVKFSVMSPGIHVWPHVGPTNCRLRAHLGLVVPEGPLLRVVKTKKTWEEGKIFIFDDSFEHEVWHEGSELRLVLIVDFWHPELTKKQREKLSAI